MPKESAEEKPRPRRLLTYVGVREGGKKLHHAYISVGDDWQERDFPADPLPALADDLQLFGKRFGFIRQGSVISIEYDPEKEGTVYTDTARAVGQIDDKVAAAWRAASDAVKAAWDLKRKAHKEAARDLQLELLEPLRETYRGLRDRNQRTAFLARVMAYITD
jgi:hypothetical protein